MTMIVKHSDLLTRDMLTTLLDATGGPHVSIYMPTHREWSAVERDPILLKNQIREATDKLIESGMRSPTAIEFMSEAEHLVERENFWQYQSDGLALFIAQNQFKYFRLPLKLDKLVVVGQRYYVKPLFELFADDGCFYVLSLSEKDVRLYQGTANSIREIELVDTATNLDDALGLDDNPDRISGFHSGAPERQGSQKQTIAHGHGTARDGSIKKKLMFRFVNELEPAVRRVLQHENAPLVLAGLSTVRSMYADANHYPHLIEAGIDVNPQSLTDVELHQRAFSLVQPLFARARQQAEEAFGNCDGAGAMHVAADIESVLSAAYQHRVAKLFLPRGSYLWGRFDAVNGSVQVHPNQREGDLELLDLAAAYTLQGNGEVFTVAPGEMPEEANVAALLRY